MTNIGEAFPNDYNEDKRAMTDVAQELGLDELIKVMLLKNSKKPARTQKQIYDDMIYSNKIEELEDDQQVKNSWMYKYNEKFKGDFWWTIVLVLILGVVLFVALSDKTWGKYIIIAVPSILGGSLLYYYTQDVLGLFMAVPIGAVMVFLVYLRSLGR